MKKIEQLLSNVKLESRDLKLFLFNVIAVFVMAVLQHLHLNPPHMIASLFSLGSIFGK